MRGRYRLTFEFADTEREARAEVIRINAHCTRYIRTHKPAHYTPWEARDAQGRVTESKYIVWYYN